MPGYKILSKSLTNIIDANTYNMYMYTRYNECLEALRAHNTQNSENGKKLILPCQIIKYTV